MTSRTRAEFVILVKLVDVEAVQIPDREAGSPADANMGWIVRAVLIAGDLIAGWFVARDALNFPVVSFVAALFLFVVLVALLAFWPTLVQVFRKLTGLDKPK